MSRDGDACPAELFRFPRVSGDEPHALSFKVVEGVFSPRERG